jgi:2-oxoglutarate dehydrogenase E2 component (dihydrolipoamide succinyltransferase)
MAIEIKIPELGESITEVQVAAWLVKEGDTVTKDQNLVSIESEKATVEIAAPEAGVLSSILQPDGSTVHVGDVIGRIESGQEKAETPKATPSPAKAEPKKESKAPKPEVAEKKPAENEPAEKPTDPEMSPPATPNAKPAKKIQPPEPTGIDDPINRQEKIEVTSEPISLTEAAETEAAARPAPPATKTDSRADEIKPMSPLRRTVAKRLVEAQQTMAILTTFNEIDMSNVIALRKQHQEPFQTKTGVKLGFMSFFVKAVIEAFKAVPQLNAEIRGNDIVYHRYVDIGVAVGAGKGLVVPPLRNAERLSFAEIEKAIADLGTRAKENKLKPQELEGGTFTISNGGVYGSLLSTPIINPPQSGILGLHAIQERPVARNGQVVIRPMMYVALSYDHRIVDGREAVQFLVRVKEVVEEPTRMLLDI